MEQAELENLIGDVEVAIDRLRSLYDQYFMGIERIEPGVARKDVDRKIYVLRREHIRNTALRFRFQMVLQRYNTFQSHWQRICREIENGTYKRHMLRAEQRFGRGPTKKASLTPPPPDPSVATTPPPLAGPMAPPLLGPMAPPPLPTGVRPEATARFKPPPGAALPAQLAAELAELDKDFAPPPAQDDLLLAAARGARPPRPPPPRAPVAVEAKPPSIATQTPTAVRAPNASLLATMSPIAKPPGASPAAPIAKPPAAPIAKPPAAPIAKPLAPPSTTATVQAAASLPKAANEPRPAPTQPTPTQATPTQPTPTRPTPTVVRPGVSVPTPLVSFPIPAQIPREALRPSPPPPPAAKAAIATRKPPSDPPARTPARPASVPVPRPAPKESNDDNLSDHRVRQLYVEFVEAKRRQNESTAAITYETVAKSLRDSSERLRQRHGKPIDFEIAIRDGKTFLKPVLK